MPRVLRLLPRSASGSASPSRSTDGAAQDEPFDSHLAAFDLETQEPLWDPVALDAVSRTGVTVGDGMAYLGVNGGTIYAVDLAKGKVAWTAELGRPVATQPAFTDGTVVVGLQASRQEPHPTVVALDAPTGEERWRADDESQAAIVSTASIADGTVYVAFTGGQESSIDAFDLDTGGRRWRTRFPRFFDLTATTPPVVTDDAVYVTDAQGETYRLDPATGTRTWEFALNEGVLRTAPIAVGDHVLVGTIDGSLVALEASGGDLVWRDDGDGSPLRALAVAGDRVIAVRAGAGAGLVAFVHDDGGGARPRGLAHDVEPGPAPRRLRRRRAGGRGHRPARGPGPRRPHRARRSPTVTIRSKATSNDETKKTTKKTRTTTGIPRRTMMTRTTGDEQEQEAPQRLSRAPSGIDRRGPTAAPARAVRLDPGAPRPGLDADAVHPHEPRPRVRDRGIVDPAGPHLHPAAPGDVARARRPRL